MLREVLLDDALIRFDGEIFERRARGSLRFHRELMPSIDLGEEMLQILCSPGELSEFPFSEVQAPALEELVADVSSSRPRQKG